MQLIRSQPSTWQWRWKQSPMPSAGLPQEVTIRPHMSSSSQIQWSSYKKWRVEWEAQTEMSEWSTSTFKTSCGCTALDMPEWRETTEQIDWRANHPSQVFAFREIWSVEKLETLPAGTKPRTSHHWSHGGERLWKRKRETIFLERTRESHRHQTNIGTVSERRGGAHMGISERILNWTDSN